MSAVAAVGVVDLADPGNPSRNFNPRLFDYDEGMVSLFLLVFGWFFCCVNITKCHILIKTADVIIGMSTK